MKPMLKSFVAFSLAMLVFVACKKTSDEKNQEIGDSLNEQDNAFIESVSVPNPTLKQILGHDGNPLGRFMGVQGTAGKLIDAILQDAQSLSGQKILTYPGEGTNKPEHQGLVYSKGQRNFTERLTPPGGNNLHRQYAVFGTDCSGFIINLLSRAGLNIPNTNVANFESTLKQALKDNATYKTLSLKNLGHIPTSEIKSGDFVLWIRGADNNHMGIIAELSSGLGKTVFQSNGTGNPSNDLQQTKNLGRERGVHPIDFIKTTTGTGYWGTGYIILRLENDKTELLKLLKGKWLIYKYVNRVHDVNGNLVDTNFLLSTEQSLVFSENGTFMSLVSLIDGSPQTICNGIYSLEANDIINMFHCSFDGSNVIQKISLSELEILQKHPPGNMPFNRTSQTTYYCKR